MRLWFLFTLIFATAGSTAFAEPALKRSNDAASIRAQLYHRDSATRVAGARRAAELPPIEGVKLLVPHSLADSAESVRLQAFETLQTWKNNPEAADLLFKTLEKECRGTAPSLLTAPLIGVLVDAESANTREKLDSVVSGYVKNSKTGAIAVTSLVDSLANRADPKTFPALKNLLAMKCCVNNFACHRATVQALIKTPNPEAVELLIDHLANLDGEIRGDIVRYLTRISNNEPCGVDAAAWQRWWKAKKPTFAFPANPGGIGAGLVPAAVLAEPKADVSYYGLSIYAKKIVFIIDISSSMSDRDRIGAAKRELIQTIQSLPEDAAFSVIVFNDRIALWQRQLQPAKTAAKQNAIQFIERLRPGGMTASFDAIDAAFTFDAEAIYFLSDGAPSCGRIVEPARILSTVHEANRSRRLSIYAIGIAPGAPGSSLETFMRGLSDQNYGQFRRVD